MSSTTKNQISAEKSLKMSSPLHNSWIPFRNEAVYELRSPSASSFPGFLVSLLSADPGNEVVSSTAPIWLK